MSDPFWIDELCRRSRALQTEAAALEGVREAHLLALDLDHALARLQAPDELRRPLHVALLGGTGVGKSHLFNALLNWPEASPVSADVRCFTTQPHIAVAPIDRPLIQIPEVLCPVYLDSAFPGVVLLDTPDVDGVRVQNRAATRQLIEHSDVILYVTDPNKRANFDLHQEVRDWTARKRWFFVLNKADLYEATLTAVREDFDRRLRELGFVPEDGVRFVVSAAHPERFDFARLRETVLRSRPEEQLTVLRRDAFLGYAQHAVQPERVYPISEKVAVLKEAEKELTHRIQEAYRGGLKTPEAVEAFRLVAREATWRHLMVQCGWFLALPVMVRCRFSLMWTGYQAGRLVLGGVNLLRLLSVAAMSVFLAVRGLLPLRNIVMALGRTYQRQVAEVQVDARRVLEDHGLVALAPNNETPRTGDSPDTSSLSDEFPASSGTVDKFLRALTLQGLDQELLSQLEADLERIGQRTARAVLKGVLGWLVWLVGNALPAAMLLWILWRVGASWWQEDYLHAPFYAMALTLELASFLPGLWLLIVVVKRRTAAPDAPSFELVQYADQPRATSTLRAVAQRLERFTNHVDRLHQRIKETRASLEQTEALPGASPKYLNGHNRSDATAG